MGAITKHAKCDVKCGNQEGSKWVPTNSYIAVSGRLLRWVGRSRFGYNTLDEVNTRGSSGWDSWML